MDDRPQSAFRSAFEQLSADEQTAFVADLYRAQDWTVDVNGRQLTVHDGGTTKTVYVGEPSRAGDADTVVPAPTTTGTIHSMVTRRLPGYRPATDPDTLPIDELRQQLLYALDREQATALCAEHFDDSFEAAVGLDRANQQGDKATQPSRRSVQPGILGIVALLLLTAGAVAALVGPAGVVDGPAVTTGDSMTDIDDTDAVSSADGNTGAATDGIAADEPSDDVGDGATGSTAQDVTTVSSSTPDWLDGGELASLDQLLSHHQNESSTLSGATFRVEYEGPTSLINFDDAEPIGGNRSRAVYEIGPAAPNETGNDALVHHSDDRATADVSRLAATADAAPTVPAPESMLRENGTPLLQTYLDETNQIVVPLDGDDGEAVFNDTADGFYVIFANQPPESAAVTNFQADGLATADGFIRYFQVSYEVDGEPVSIAFEFH